MPEYPEVTVVRKSLNNYVKNRFITKIEVKVPKLIKNTNQENFVNFLLNEQVLDVENFGKFLVFNLKSKKRLISHLRMSGKYFIRQENDPNLYAYKHDCIYFFLDNQNVVVYNDSRMFGSFEIINSDDLRSLYEIKKLAQLPRDVDVKILFNKIKNKNISIKKVLLDQSLVLGIGNIYADESLFASKIYPMKKAKDVTLQELKTILNHAQNIMDKSIELGGSSVQTYSSVNGITGKFQNNLMVYSKHDQLCQVCKQEKIVKVKLDFKENGRGTSYCPKCQN
ncbi:DNA-formamidopyrimidine glycosylase [Mycoplasma leonicaptivi]|uniref:DNA-formamidopyrimidine glycosylase n=1 Tax=Mycoplasma leonicaptivi TaxID=36742 RepID=UPI0004848D8A|nr:DNA-formamidopyrimidine glycosylase [Mycoplasma leonicaptivi]